MRRLRPPTTNAGSGISVGFVRATTVARHDLVALPRQTISPETDRDEREGDDLDRRDRDEHPLAEVRAATLQQLTVLEAAPAAELDPAGGVRLERRSGEHDVVTMRLGEISQ